MMENENYFFNLINHKIIHSWKVTNVVMYCDARTDVHTYTQTNTLKDIYILLLIYTNYY